MTKASLLAWGLVLTSACGCSADQRGHPTAGIATPLVMRVALPSSVASSAVVAAPLDLEAFSPLLSLPELKAAADALEAGDPARASHEVETALARHGSGDENRSFLFLLARLREAAMDFGGAAASYQLAASGVWPLSGYSWLGAGRALLRLGRPGDARVAFDKVPLDEPIAEDAKLGSADAALALGDTAFAVTIWRDHLARGNPTEDPVPLSLRLGETLVAQAATTAPDDPSRVAAGREALGLARRALARATESAAVARAHVLEGTSLALIPAADRAANAEPSPAEDLERLKTLVDAKDFVTAIPFADALVVRLGEKDEWSQTGCETMLLRTRAIAGIHDLHLAESAGVEVARRCKDPDIRAQALFLAGKYATLEKRYADAVQHYEALERECPGNRLADDARLKSALCYEELGAEGRFTELLTRMPDDYPEGDMLLDGMFELAKRRIEKGDWAGAATVLERATTLATATDVKRGQEFAGRERYFRARAWGALGETDKSTAEYEAIVRDLPLSYYMLQAYSRLASVDPPRADRALADALRVSAEAPFTFAHQPEFELPGFRRALELLRVGDIDDASREMDALGLRKPSAAPQILWAVALLYERAGAAKLSHDVTEGPLTDWLGRWPSGDWSRAWQVAFPRPYHDLVAREAKRSGLPEYLVYAIMREESSFDPDAESPVKAYGLMQLIEPTALQFGKPLGFRPDATSLKRPSVNVAIGCRVLSELTRSFAENPLLAIPGYNAGAGRSRKWEGDRPAADFDVWVELIPYTETRRYTKRVLAARATYAFLYDRAHAEDAMRLPIQLVKTH